MGLKVYLMRHGETNFNKKSLEWGQDDRAPLNELGILQSKKIANRLKGINFKKIFSSKLKRAIQTAEEIKKSSEIEITPDDRLKEYDPGEIDPSSEEWMNEYNDVLQSGMSKYDIRPFGGENIWDLIKRTESFMEEIEKEDGIIGIISHSGFNSVFINLSQKKEKQDFFKVKQDNACINILEFSKGEWKIDSINDSEHLNDTIPKKNIYENQNEIKEIAKKYVLEKLKEISNKTYLGGDLVIGEFGNYERPYKRHKGSTIETYAQLKSDFEIPRKWKISLFLEDIKKYEIGYIYVGEVKHKVNLNLIVDDKDIEKIELEEILDLCIGSKKK